MNEDYIKLDFSDKDFESYLQRTAALIAETHQDIENRKVFQNREPRELHDLFNAPLPESGQDMDSLLEELEQHVINEATLNVGPHFYSYVLSPGNQAGLIGDMVGSYLNQNTAKWHLNSAGSEIEKRVIKWIGEFLNYSKDAGGIILSGGSTANLVCLNVARNQKAGYNINREGVKAGPSMILYVSDQVHYCVEKSAAMLGIGTAQVRKITSNEDYTMNLEALETAIEADINAGNKPFCIVGSAGTVNTGAVDPLNAIADLCEKYDLWFHVDGAYGGPAAALDSHATLFKGMERADSVAVDPHKWLYVPLEAGCAIFKNSEDLRKTFSFIPEYLVGDRQSDRHDFMEYGPQLTRSFKALKTWVTFKHYGADNLRTAIHDDIRKVEYLGKKIDELEDFEVLSEPSLSIVCFRFNPAHLELSQEELNQLNTQLIDELEREGRVFITGTTIKGNRALRICIVNHRTQKKHLDFMLETVIRNSKKLGVYEKS